MNPDEALRCDCGYDFGSGTVQTSYLIGNEEHSLTNAGETQRLQKGIRYNLHFPILVLAFVAFCVVMGPYTQSGSPYTDVMFGLIGALHAISIVASLREPAISRPAAAMFFILAAFWSFVTPTLALYSLYLAPILGRGADGRFGFLALYLPGSAIGASGYWLLVRLFWLKSLRRADWLKTVLLCMAATLLSAVAGELLNPYIFFPLITAAWWFAFSISLYWSESGYIASSNGAIEPYPRSLG